MNPDASDPRQVLSDHPELLDHEMIGAFIRDHRSVDYWSPVDFGPEYPGVKP